MVEYKLEFVGVSVFLQKLSFDDYLSKSLFQNFIDVNSHCLFVVVYVFFAGIPLMVHSLTIASVALCPAF